MVPNVVPNVVDSLTSRVASGDLQDGREIDSVLMRSIVYSSPAYRSPGLGPSGMQGGIYRMYFYISSTSTKRPPQTFQKVKGSLHYMWVRAFVYKLTKHPGDRV